MKKRVIRRRRNFLEHICAELKLLELDIQLRQEGYRYLYVVDFSAIYSYAYKTLTSRSLPSLDGQTDRAFARRQVALKLIFSDPNRPLLLIPPYAAELRNHLDVVSMHAKLAGRDLKDRYVRTLRHLIKQSPEFQTFVRVDDSNEKLPGQTSRAAALEIGKKYFPELYTVVACTTTKSIESLRELFAKGLLRDAELELPQMSNFGYASSEAVTNRWYDALLELRPEGRAFQTFVDALACAYVEIANSKLNVEKQIVVFVSPSGHVRQTIGSHPLIRTLADLTMPVVRDLDYFLLSFTHKDDLQRVRDTLRLSSELLRAYGQTEERGGLTNAKRKEILKNSETRWQLAENRLLLTDSTLLDEIGLADSSRLVEDSFFAILRLIAEAARRDTGELERQAKLLISELWDGMIKLDRMVPAAKLTALLSELEVQRRNKKVRIVCPALQDEMPITIEFSDPLVAQLGARLAHIESSRDRQAAVALRQEIMQSAAKQDASTEHSLLAAYILAMEAKLDAALAEILSCLVSNRTGKRKELCYLAALIYRKLTQPAPAAEFILKALNEDNEESRFQLEYGRILWQMSLLGPPNANQDDLAQALVHFNLALEKAPSREQFIGLRVQAKNALAYTYCELSLKDRVDYLNVAEQHFTDLREAIPQEDQWIGRFHDTAAWIAYAKATLNTVDAVESRLHLLSQARQQIDKALEKSKSRGTMELLLHSHKSHIMEATERLVSRHWSPTTASG